MSAKRLGSVALLVVLTGSASAQTPTLMESLTAKPVPATLPAPSPQPLPTALGTPAAPAAPQPSSYPPGTVFSPWMNNPQCADCLGPVGGDGLIVTELYGRFGVQLLSGNGYFSDVLGAGVGMTAGSRSLFYNPTGETAWTIDVGLGHYVYQGRADSPQISFVTTAATDLAPAVTSNFTVRSYRTTPFHFAGGRQWYLYGSANERCNGLNWLFGTEVGGRWSTSRLELNDLTNPPYNHLSDVIGTTFLGAYTGVEVPLGGAWLWTFGFRGEWEYTWSSILSPADRSSDYKTINLYLTTGFRY